MSQRLFREAKRVYIESPPQGERGWLAGLRAAQVSRALALMHTSAARPWTVDDPGREVGLSRYALAER